MASLLEILENSDSFSRYSPLEDEFVDFFTNLIREQKSDIFEDASLFLWNDGAFSDTPGLEVNGPPYVDEDLVEKPFLSLIEDHGFLQIGVATASAASDTTTTNIHAKTQTIGFPRVQRIYANEILLHNDRKTIIEVTDSEVHIYPTAGISKLNIGLSDGVKKGINRNADSNLGAGKIKVANATNANCVNSVVTKANGHGFGPGQFSQLIQKK
jgi:hypothetical protein